MARRVILSFTWIACVLNDRLFKRRGAHEIDQVNKTITKITSSGERLNFFAYRGKTYSVFEPIPSGENYITYSNDFTFSNFTAERKVRTTME